MKHLAAGAHLYDDAERRVQIIQGQLQHERTVVAVIGRPNAGKTTLIFALSQCNGVDSLIKPIPSSSVLVRLFHAKPMEILVYFENGDQKRISPQELADYATEQGNPENTKRVTGIDVSCIPGDAPIAALELLDTPGFEWKLRHTAFAIKALMQAHAVLVVLRGVITNSDGIYLRKSIEHRVRDCVFVQNAELGPEQARVQMEDNRRRLQQLGVKDPRMFLVNPVELDHADNEFVALREYLTQLPLNAANLRLACIADRALREARQLSRLISEEQQTILLFRQNRTDEIERLLASARRRSKTLHTSVEAAQELIDRRVPKIQAELEKQLDAYFDSKGGLITECKEVLNDGSFVWGSGDTQVERLEKAINPLLAAFVESFSESLRREVNTLAAEVLRDFEGARFPEFEAGVEISATSSEYRIESLSFRNSLFSMFIRWLWDDRMIDTLAGPVERLLGGLGRLVRSIIAVGDALISRKKIVWDHFEMQLGHELPKLRSHFQKALSDMFPEIRKYFDQMRAPEGEIGSVVVQVDEEVKRYENMLEISRAQADGEVERSDWMRNLSEKLTERPKKLENAARDLDKATAELSSILRELSPKRPSLEGTVQAQT